MRTVVDQLTKAVDMIGILSLSTSLIVLILTPYNEYFPFVGRSFFLDVYLLLSVSFLVYCGWAWGDLLRHGSFPVAVRGVSAATIAIVLLLGLPNGINRFPERLIRQMPPTVETGLGWAIAAVVLLTPAVLGARVYKKLRWGWLAAILVFVVSLIVIFGRWYVGPWDLQSAS
ncbi:hypothetical protein [Calidithermus chliarophilus]|uniref:hypothetical protein n=1 Tax=Calidithermus chliarophilus TaxID=52023 RepID=UPI0004172426|nr:hypothetical protein [Calidithermus chliarophilus]